MYRTTVNGTVTGTIPLFHEEMPGNTPQMPCPTEDETVINRPHPAQQGRAVNTVAGIYYCCCSSARWFGVDIRYSLVQYDTGKPVFRWDTKNERTNEQNEKIIGVHCTVHARTGVRCRHHRWTFRAYEMGQPKSG